MKSYGKSSGGGAGDTILILGIFGLIAYVFFLRPGVAAVSAPATPAGFTPYSSATPFNLLSIDPSVAMGQTPGGYQPPVFGSPVLPPPAGVAV